MNASVIEMSEKACEWLLQGESERKKSKSIPSENYYDTKYTEKQRGKKHKVITLCRTGPGVKNKILGTKT